MPRNPLPNDMDSTSHSQMKSGKKPKRIKLTLGVRYRALVEQIPAIIYTDSAEKIFQTLYINPQIKTITGYEPEEWIADNDLWYKMILPDDRERVIQEYTRNFSIKEPFISEYRIMTRDGRIIWVSDEMRLLRDKKGIPLFWQGVMVDITSRKHAEEENHRAQQRMEMLVTSSTVMLYTCNAFGDFDATFVSDNIYAITGFTKEEFLSKGFWANHLHPDDATKVLENLAFIFKNDHYKHEYRFRYKDGTYHWMYDELKLFKDKHGKPLEIFGTWSDITARKEAEEALSQSEDKFKYVFDYSNIGKSITSLGGEIHVNKAFGDMLGYDPDELQGTNWQDLTHPDDIEVSQIEYDSILSGKIDTARFTKRYLKKNGSIVWTDVSTSLRRDKQGKPQYFISAEVDITERKQAERVREVLYTISQAAITEDLEDLYISIHTALRNLMPVENFYIALYDLDADLISIPYCVDQHDTSDPPRKPGHGLTEYVLRTGSPLLVDQQAFSQLVQKGEVELVGADSVDWLGVPLKMGDKIFGVIAVQSYTELVRFTHADMEMLEFVSAQITPVIERKRAEAVLRASEAKYRALVDTSPDGITLTDLAGKLVLCNQQTVRLHGYDNLRELYGINVFELIAPEDRQLAMKNAQKTLEEGQVTNIEYKMLRKDGSRFPAELSAALICDKDGAPANFIAITRDVTERFQAIEAEKRLLLLKEEFIASLSHDLRTPIFSLIGYLDLLRNGKVKDSDVQNEFLTRAAKDVDRLKVLVNELLDTSRLENNFLVLNWEEVDLNTVINQVLESFREQAKANGISLKASPSDKRLLAEVDPSRMHRVLSNLVENAIKFSYKGGDILIAMESRNSTVTIEVIDNGCGISPEDCLKVFDKFFQASHTLKQNKFGTGLGLFISKQIVEAHGGTLTVKSQLGIGSTFTVTIPKKKSS